MSNRRHVFISHHHADDNEVDKLTRLLSKGHDIRNSSIRAKPANQRRIDEGIVSEKVLQRLLRMKISWASTVVVLIGKETNARRWVNWEIDQAHKQGKRIVGIFVRGGTKADIPPSFEKYGSALVAWNTKSITEAIDGSGNEFQNPTGTPREAVHKSNNCEC